MNPQLDLEKSEQSESGCTQFKEKRYYKLLVLCNLTYVCKILL